MCFSLPFEIEYKPDAEDKDKLFEITYQPSNFEGNLIMSSHAKYPNSFWIGWVNIYLENEEHKQILKNKLETNYNSIPIFLEKDYMADLIDSVYVQILDPIFYDFIHLDTINEKLSQSWAKLHDFNKEIADTISNYAKRNTFIILMSHELILVPIYLCQKLLPSSKNRPSIGLYLSNGFPSLSVLKFFPYTEDILVSMLSSDVITFQKNTGCSGFLKLVKKNLGIGHHIQKGIVSIKFHGRLVIIRTSGLCTNGRFTKKFFKDIDFNKDYVE